MKWRVLRNNERKAEAPDLTMRLAARLRLLTAARPATFLIWNLAGHCPGNAKDIYSSIDGHASYEVLSALHSGKKNYSRGYLPNPHFASPTQIMMIFGIYRGGAEPRPFVVCTNGRPKARPR